MAYVYRHIRLDKNEPFYIGIGKTRYRPSSKKRNEIWDRIVAKTKYEVEIVMDGITWDEACKKEIELIKLYGRINRSTGILANMTDGGDGNLGLVHSADAIRRISESSKKRAGHWKGKKMSDEFKNKLSLAKKGRPILAARGKKMPQHAIEAVRNHSFGNKYHLGKKHSEKSKAKMGLARKGKPAPNKGKPGQSGSKNGMYGKVHSDETRKKISEALKKRHKNGNEAV
jgi:NUMOD3 motif